MIIFDQNLCVVLKIEKLNLDFTKIAFKPLYTNLFNIVLLAFFLTIGSNKSYSQDLPKNNTEIKAKEDIEFSKSNAKEIKISTDTIKKDTLKPKKALLESKIKRKAVGYEKINQKKKQMTLYDKAELFYQDIELKSGIIVLDYEKNEIYAGRIKDSTGKYTQLPVFKQDSNVIEPDSIRFNFKTKKGFLSSNRDGGQGSDDIYKFVETKPIWCEQILHGIVTDEDTKAVLPNTKLQLFDNNFNKIKETTSDAAGKYEFTEVQCGKKYYVRASLEDYTTKEVSVIIKKETGKTELNIELKSESCKVKIGDDLANCFKINIIYFDLDKWNIRPDAAIDLAKLLDVLEQNPSMKINIRSHTDSRASDKYNDVLSKNRAKSTKDWLIKNGISADRLTSEGLGEKELVNKCADDVQCSEAEHQLNRRSEFIITAL